MEENNALLMSEARRNWAQARQEAVIQEVMSVFSRRPTGLLSFDEVKNRLRLMQKNYRGIQDIELDRIRGSVGRYRDFTSTFLPRYDQMRERWERVSRVALSQGVPPIEVYQVGEAYFVLDGNHRVSIARQANIKTIQAHVWEFVTPFGLSADADLDELIIKAERADFLECTHLDRLYPDQNIVFTTPGHYRELECQIEGYRQALEQIDEMPFSYEEAVKAWYDMIYTPAVQIIRERGVLGRDPNRNEDHLIIWVLKNTQDQRAYGYSSVAKASCLTFATHAMVRAFSRALA
jgi:hypothetical protein